MSAELPGQGIDQQLGSKEKGDHRGVLASIVAVVAAVLWAPQAWLIASTVGELATQGKAENLLPVSLAVAALGTLRAVLDAAATRLSFKAARPELSRHRAAATAGLSERSPSEKASGECASILGEQADMLLPYLARYNIARLKAVAIPTVFLAVVAFQSWVAALILLISAPLIPLFMALIGWRAQAASEKQLAATGSLNGFLLDRLRGLSTIRSLKAVDMTAERLRRDADSLRHRTMAVLRIAFLSSAVLELFAALGVALIAVYVGFALLGTINAATWGDALDLSTGLFILLLAPAFFEPLRELSAVWHDKAAGVAARMSLESLAKPAGTAQRMPDPAVLPAKADGRHAVVIKDVVYAYSADCPIILDALNIAVRHGEKLALVGASGSGKSTVLGLIAGFLTPQSGQVLVDGKPHCRQTPATIGWIGQATHVFAGTIRSNIAMGRDLPRGAIDEAIRVAGLERVAAAHGHSILGEAGVGLSGGEIVRLGIARAAADENCSIILADEPTAHLDSLTAAEVIAGLQRLARNRTLIVATHDPVLASQMDRSVVIGGTVLREAAE